MPRPALPAAELRRFAGSPRALLSLLAVFLVPLVFGGLSTWANESPTTRVDQIAAAVVNLDEPVTLKGADGKDQIVPLGRVVVGKLTASASASNYSWTLTDAATAEAGLGDGRFGAVLTIPADFSRSATSTNGAPADARAARLQLRTNDAVNYLDGSIARTIATSTSADAARTVTESYLQAMYAGYGTLHDQLATAADGADKLASGVGELTVGAEKAATGAGSLASGVDQIASGAGDLASGADKLADGADQAAAGLKQLSGGLATMDTQVAALPAGTRQLADGAAQVSGGVSSLAAGAASRHTPRVWTGSPQPAPARVQRRHSAPSWRASPPRGPGCGPARPASPPGPHNWLLGWARQAREQPKALLAQRSSPVGWPSSSPVQLRWPA